MAELLGCLVLLAAGSAHGVEDVPGEQDPAVCIGWASRPGTGCPTVEETRIAIGEILGHHLSSGPPCNVEVGGTMRQLPDRAWEADLHFSKSDGVSLGDRILQSHDASCAALKGPVSLVIALMVEPEGTRTTLHMPAARPQPRSRKEGNRLSVNMSVSSGLLPTLAFGASAGLQTNLVPWLPLRLDTTFWFPGRSEPAGPGGKFWAWQAGAGLCPAVMTTAAARGQVCAAVEAGAIHGTGLGLDYSSSATKPYGEGAAHALLVFPLFGPVMGFIDFGAAIPWLRPRFVYLDRSGAPVEVHRPQAAIPFGGLGIAVGQGRETAVSTWP